MVVNTVKELPRPAPAPDIREPPVDIDIIEQCPPDADRSPAPVPMEIGLNVMGTVRRTGVAGLFIGTTAEMILRQVDCSVLTVKPEGFVTPVRLDE